MIRRIYKSLRKKYLKFKFRNRPYSELYGSLMDKKALLNPKSAVGGLWDELGQLQFDYLISKGLKPESTLLEYGCGSLRAGRFFIKYLNPGNYTGVDISENLITSAKELLNKEDLGSKAAELIVTHDLTLSYLKKRYDFGIATSVFTHMLIEDIEIVLFNLKKKLSKGGCFYSTFLDLNDKGSITNDYENFYYSIEMFSEIANGAGLSVELDTSFKHPRNQKMLIFRNLEE